VIAYRQVTRTVSTEEVLVGAGDALTFLMEFGEIEAALADQLCPDEDALEPELVRLREITREAGRAFVAGRAVSADLTDLQLPERIEISVPNGYAWHALSPASYIAPAERFWRERQPRDAVVIGIRGIGASLSAVVAATLEQHGCRVESYTVRPQGDPSQKELRLADDLRQALTRTSRAFYVVVDEGPGLSGSSFASVAEGLSALGISDHRIVFMPAWLPDGRGFVSRGAEARWRIHAKYAAACARPDEAWIDLSAGEWRPVFYSDDSAYPAVQPQHEAAKFLNRQGVVRFAGLGRYGAEKLRRARLLADARFSPRPIGLRNGWLAMEFVHGVPLSIDILDDVLLETMARYMAFRRQAFGTGETARTADLAEMIRVNLGVRAPRPPKTEAVITDGRMLPHEWIATSSGYLKTDALDHGDNYFLPGPTDICWDLAGAMIEWQLEDRERERLLKRYVRHSGDRRAPDRLPFYLLAYAAFRIGYTKLAIDALPYSPDRRRFERLNEQYLEAVDRQEAATAR
jgi:hypothetical protein